MSDFEDSAEYLLKDQVRDTAVATGTNLAASAAARAGLEGLAGNIAGLANPLMWALQIKDIVDYLGSRKDAREAEEEAERARYMQAREELAQQGIDIDAMYAPSVFDVSQYEDLMGLPTSMSPEQMSNYAKEAALRDYMSGKTQGFAPADYGMDVGETVADIWKDPSRAAGVIFGPSGATGNIIWGGGTGRIPGADPAIYTGTYGTVNTGVTTGIPVVDAAVRRVLNQQVGGQTTTADVLAEGAADILGVPIDEVIDILESSGVISPSTPAGGSSTPTPQTPSQTPSADQTGGTTSVGVETGETLYEKIREWLRRNKDATDEEIRTAAEQAKVTPEDIAKATGTSIEDVQGRWDKAGTTTKPPVLDTPRPPPPVLDTPRPPPPPPITPGDIIGTGPGSLDTVTPPGVIDVPPATGGGGGGGGGGGLNLPTGPSMRTVTTAPGDLAVIDYLYDIGGESIFAPMTLADSEEEDKRLARIRNLQSTPYAQGGPVDIVELLLQRLRG